MEVGYLKRIGLCLHTQVPACTFGARLESSIVQGRCDTSIRNATSVECTHTQDAARFRWSRDKAVASAVIVQNFPPSMMYVPSEVANVLGTVSTQLLRSGTGGRRRRADVHAELGQEVLFSQIERWEQELRERLRVDEEFASRADVIEIVPYEAAVALPQCSGRVVVADTDSLSLIFKDSTRGAGLKEALGDFDEKIISFQTAAELHAWIMISCFDDERAQQLQQFLSCYKVVYPDDETCLIWAMLMNYCDTHGRPGGAQDMWVAATALRYGAILCTSNHKDYDYLPWLQLLMPKGSAPSRQCQNSSCKPNLHLDACRAFKWDPTQVFVESVVVQNFDVSLAAVPTEILEVFGKEACSQLLPGGKAARKQRTDVRVQLPHPLQIGHLQTLQDNLRAKLAANSTSERAKQIGLAPENVVVVSQPAHTDEIIVIDTTMLLTMFKNFGIRKLFAQACGANVRKVIGFQTVADLYNIVWSRCWREDRISKLEQFLADFEVVYPDELMTLIWATLMNYCRAHAFPTGEQNVWIAATALRYGASICTASPQKYENLSAGIVFLALPAE